ncbi:hypothetical protein COT97_05900 [Candidatus Falkowbacteria bacterium CG10_big_fil_rev_8_21_14_0_10_39_11]|uniref:Uncharacterized protein n=1 Tax=Candidatus Falkowbacteria bacterium CG10_big_fil_rev_8_21_14_0_10_39_11 TaxID=1974565 RepID=A0A2H0V3E8_9BACT|nr:MAG: hypothetical protein COT97_05900 [Candidatus Falkowbacteria bacterium CG10_big_fil_rev_8_21_14_0_10_39_11]
MAKGTDQLRLTRQVNHVYKAIELALKHLWGVEVTIEEIDFDLSGNQGDNPLIGASGGARLHFNTQHARHLCRFEATAKMPHSKTNASQSIVIHVATRQADTAGFLLPSMQNGSFDYDENNLCVTPSKASDIYLSLLKAMIQMRPRYYRKLSI